MKNFFFHSSAVPLFLSILLILRGISAFSQIPGTSGYLPQIRLTATNGFGPFTIQTYTEKT